MNFQKMCQIAHALINNTSEKHDIIIQQNKFHRACPNSKFSASFIITILPICLVPVSAELTPPISFRFKFEPHPTIP